MWFLRLVRGSNLALVAIRVLKKNLCCGLFFWNLRLAHSGNFFVLALVTIEAILLIRNIVCSWMLEQMIWLWKHTSHTKVYFNEFVANALHGPDHFWLCRLLEAKNTLAFGLSHSASSTYQRFTKKWDQLLYKLFWFLSKFCKEIGGFKEF